MNNFFHTNFEITNLGNIIYNYLMKDLQVITGCMFAGKTTELINRLKSLNENYLLVKPKVDIRDHGEKIVTHGGITEQAISVHKLSDIFEKLSDIKVVGVDEAQFFKKSIISDLYYLNSQNIRIIVAGLEKDYLNQPFGSMVEIISIADKVIRLKAICHRCGEDAIYSHRKNTHAKEQFLIGNKNFYEALCERCFQNNKIL